MKSDLVVEVVSHTQVAGDVFLLTVKSDEIARNASPGQFCMVKVESNKSVYPLLRRPLSIHDVSDRGDVQFIYRVVGYGTHLLSQRCPGDKLRILGPLGHGFDMFPLQPSVLVGGGLGLAPLFFLAKRLPKDSTTAIIGAPTKTKLLLPRLKRFSEVVQHLFLATEDGSVGSCGLVTDVLFEFLQHNSDSSLRVFTCGPLPMMRMVYSIAHKANLKCQVSLETRMACGIGVCLGCAIRCKNNQRAYVCTDGPVFNGEDVWWEYLERM